MKNNIKNFALLLVCLLVGLVSAEAANPQWKVKKKKKANTVHVVKTHPKAGTKVTVINHNAKVVAYNHKNYYRHNGVFYVRQNKGYVVVTPPVGIVVTSIHANAVVVRHRGVKYYRYNNVYWRYKGGKYICVKAPF